MAKAPTLINLANLTNQTTAVAAINSNSSAISTAFEDVLSLSGTVPNQMQSNLDMNSNRIINLLAPKNATEPLRMQDVSDFNTGLGTLTSIVNGLVVGSGSAVVGITAVGVIASSIVAGISSIKTSGYHSIGDGGAALYTKTSSPSAGLYYITSVDGAKWVLSENNVDPKMCGAIGDGVTDATSAINTAKTHAQTVGNPLVFTNGTYITSSPLEFAKSGFKVLALGTRVIIQNITGAGRVVSFDGTTQGSSTVDQTFGGLNKFYLVGNASTSDILYTSNVHHSEFRANCSNGTSGLRVDTVVCNKYDFECSTITAPFAMGVTPIFGLIMTGSSDCKYDCIVEGVGSVGNGGIQILANCFQNQFWGTSESNQGTGVVVGTPNCFRNIFIGFDVEVNSLGGVGGFDWLILGDENTFIGCGGGGTFDGTDPATLILASRNTFINCDFTGLKNQGTSTSFEGCNMATGYVEAGSNTVVKRCLNLPDTQTNSSIFSGNTGSSTTTPGTTQYVGAVVSSTEFGAQLRMPTAGTISNLNVQTAGAPGSGQSWEFIMRKNGASTSVIATLTTNVGSDITDSFTVVAGDIISIQVLSSASASSTPIIWSYQFNPV